MEHNYYIPSLRYNINNHNVFLHQSSLPPDAGNLARITVIWAAIIALFKRIHQKFDLSFTMAEQRLMGNAAFTRLNLMNFLLEDNFIFGFDLTRLPQPHDQTWRRFTVKKHTIFIIYIGSSQKLKACIFLKLEEFHQIKSTLPIVPPEYQHFTNEMISDISCGRFRWNKGKSL